MIQYLIIDLLFAVVPSASTVFLPVPDEDVISGDLRMAAVSASRRVISAGLL